MAETQSRRVVMARVLGPFGVKGWVKIQPFTEEPDSLAEYPVWWLRVGDTGWREFVLEECERHAGHLVARMRGCNDRDEATRLSGAEVAVSRDAMPQAAEGEFYRDDLVGMTVVNLSGDDLGKVTEIFENGAHPVLRVVWQGGERLLPFIPQVVSSIGMEAGEIRVDWGADW